MFIVYLLAFSLPNLAIASTNLDSRRVCGDTYELCLPLGATSSMLPSVGSGLSSLYSDLIAAVNPDGPARFDPGVTLDKEVERSGAITFCCARNSQCMLLRGYNIPFCWDRFTTDFYFPDGSFGSIVAGNFTSAAGTQVNLIYGDWQSQNGTKGNIYSDKPSMVPDTSTLPMPTPWTSSGIGSAIPASELGSGTTMPESGTQPPTTTTHTISAITLPSTTISIGTSGCRHCNITIVPGLTGLPPVTTVFTSGTTYPVTMVILNGTGVPSASSSIYSVTIIIPPILNNGAKFGMMAPLSIVLVLAVNIVTCVMAV